MPGYEGGPVCRQSQIDLFPTPTSAGEARRFVGAKLEAWGLAALRSEVELLTSELVTNAVLHARTPISVVIAVAEGCLEVDVLDSNPRPPVTRAHREDLLADLDVLLARGETASPGDATGGDDRDPGLVVGEAGSIVAGRGLQLVNAMSDEWGVEERADGKSVWLRIAAPENWPYLPRCGCPGEGRALTAARHPVLAIPEPWDEVGG